MSCEQANLHIPQSTHTHTSSSALPSFPAHVPALLPQVTEMPPPPPLPPQEVLARKEAREVPGRKADGMHAERPASASLKASESTRPGSDTERGGRRERDHSSREDSGGRSGRHTSEPERSRNGGDGGDGSSGRHSEHSRSQRDQPESSRDAAREQGRSHDRDRHR